MADNCNYCELMQIRREFQHRMRFYIRRHLWVSTGKRGYIL